MDDSPIGPTVPPLSEPAREGALPLTTAFDLLARAPRRRLLYQLHQNDEDTTSIDALAGLMGDRDGVGQQPDDGEDDADQARIALHHVHLPKLDAADVVEYDPVDGEVRYLGDPRLGALIEWGRDEEETD